MHYSQIGYIIVVISIAISNATPNYKLRDRDTVFLQNQTQGASARTTKQVLGVRECESDTDCPLWTQCKNSSCVCREKLYEKNIVECNKYTLQLSVLLCHCVTFDNETGKLIEGPCIEHCTDTRSKKEYIPLPLNVSSLNKFMCEENWNRTGRLCGKCLPGHSPLAYSYDMRCVKCPEGNRNIWKYILAAFGPLTIFYFFILFFKINVTSSHLHGYLIFSQIISIPAFSRNLATFTRYNKNLKLPIQIVGVLYSVWNLDFFRGIYSDICLDASTLTVLALDYAVAIYPLVLILISYFLIELHDRNFRVVVFLWKPFRRVFTLFRRNWDSKTTVIDAYATFFRLTVTEIISVSIDLLIPIRAQDITSSNFTWVLYYDGTVDYFGSEHLPYAILAIVFCLIFAILPTVLLVLYPFRWFQRLLSCSRLQWRILHAVMDSFQGFYKNGTEPGTRDYRWFAAVPMIGSFTLLLIFALTLNSTYFPLATAVIICIIIITIIVQPYKRNVAKYARIDAMFWGFLACLYCINDTRMFGSLKPRNGRKITETMEVVVAIIPLIYMSCITTYWILTRMKKMKVLVSRVKAWRKDYYQLEDDFEASLPDRLLNPEQYQEENLEEPIANNETLNNTRDTY